MLSKWTDQNRFNFIKKVVGKLLTILTFYVFIVYSFETFLLVWIAVFSELRHIREGTAENSLSVVLCYFLGGVILATLIIALVQWIRFAKKGQMKSRYCSACFDGFGLKSLDKTQVMLFYVRRLSLTATGMSHYSLNNSVPFSGSECVPDNAGICKHPVGLHGGSLRNSSDELCKRSASGNAKRAHLLCADRGSVFLEGGGRLVELQNEHVHLGDGGQHSHLPPHFSEWVTCLTI